MMYYDTNDDNFLNLGDNIDAEHKAEILARCDYDDNSMLDI
jgi:hypothetical protein